MFWLRSTLYRQYSSSSEQVAEPAGRRVQVDSARQTARIPQHQLTYDVYCCAKHYVLMGHSLLRPIIPFVLLISSTLVMSCNRSARHEVTTNRVKLDSQVTSAQELTCAQSSPVAPEKSQCVLSTPDFIPSQFWCLGSHRTTGGTPLHVCYSTRDSCNRMRKEGLNVGAFMTSCRPQNSAFCFTATNAIGQTVHWRCYASDTECVTSRAKWPDRQSSLDLSQCEHTGSAS